MRVGLIGTGYWAKTVHGASAKEHPRVELVGVWGRDQSKTDAAASELGTRAYRDLDQLIAESDALTLAVPPDVQADIATRAARASKHLLLEKPVATSVAAARALEDVATSCGIATVVFFTRRFVPETRAWLSKLQELGGWECGRAEIAAQIYVEGNPFGSSPWRRDKGGLWDVGPHAMAMLWPVLGSVTSVVAGKGVRDQVHLVLTHSNGASSTASLSLDVAPLATGSTIYFYGQQGRETAPAGPSNAAAAHRVALDVLIEQAEHPGSGHPCDVHFGARVVEVLAAAEQSLQTGRRVEISPR